MRNILYYLGPIIFDEAFENKGYYYHFLTYVVSIRLLTDKYSNKQDIMDAYRLINYFCKSFSHYYGNLTLRFKLHAHIHLPDRNSHK